MAPKRKNNSEKSSSTTKKQHQINKRIIGSMELHNKNKSVVIQEKKQTRSKSKQNKKYVDSDIIENQPEIIEEDTSKDPKSMSIDSNGANSGNQELSTSDSCCSDSSNIGIQGKASSAIQFDIDDDDDDSDEFKSMFMHNTLTSKTRPSYASTPLIRSHHHNQSTVSKTPGSILSNQMQTRSPSSTNSINHQLTTSTTYSQNNNTPINSRVQINSSASSQVSIGNESLSGNNYTTNNSAVLETFLEYRTLKRELQRALNLNETWKADYQVLVRRMQRLEQSSFPRPTADGRAFIEQILDSMRSSERDDDNRSSTQLANDIGLPETTLLSFANGEPQKTALRIFNALFPNNQDKESLINVGNLNVKQPTLLENILVFARRCAPGSGYSMGMLKEAIGNSIRCAGYKMKMHQGQIVAAAAAAVQQADPDHENGMIE